MHTIIGFVKKKKEKNATLLIANESSKGNIFSQQEVEKNGLIIV